MSKCQCVNPNGGGTTCPEHYVAVCSRGHDGHCYGECVEIPEKFDHVSAEFESWLAKSLTMFAKRATSNLTGHLKETQFKIDTSRHRKHGQGTASYSIDGIQLRVNFSYQFKIAMGYAADFTRNWRAVAVPSFDGTYLTLRIGGQVGSGIVAPHLNVMDDHISAGTNVVEFVVSHLAGGPFVPVMAEVQIRDYEGVDTVIIYDSDNEHTVIAKIPVDVSMRFLDE